MPDLKAILIICVLFLQPSIIIIIIIWAVVHLAGVGGSWHPLAA